MIKRAVLDKTKKYRYTLERYWGKNKANFVNFILLNPSTADAVRDDPTVKACIEFAKRWGFDGLVFTNLFAFRATKPAQMKACLNPHGPMNDIHIKRIGRKARKIIIAWGNYGIHCNRCREVIALLGSKKLFCLGLTKSGQPKHPLYIKRTVTPRLYTPAK